MIRARSCIRHLARRAQGLLSGPEIEGVRVQLNLNQREAASLFGGGFNAFNKYESGEVLQSFAMDRLLRLTLEMGAPAVRFLRSIKAPAVLPKTPASHQRRVAVRA